MAEYLKTFVQKKILRNHKGKNSVVQAITLQPWRRSSRQTLAASEEALDQPWLAGRPWINLGEQSNAFFGSPPHNSTWGDRNYSCTLCIMCGTIAFHLETGHSELAPRCLTQAAGRVHPLVRWRHQRRVVSPKLLGGSTLL